MSAEEIDRYLEGLDEPKRGALEQHRRSARRDRRDRRPRLQYPQRTDTPDVALTDDQSLATVFSWAVREFPAAWCTSYRAICAQR